MSTENIIKIKEGDMEDVSLKEVLEKEKLSLDILNLDIAKFRVKHGMSTKLIHLYRRMGRLCKELIELDTELDSIDSLWREIMVQYNAMLARKSKKEEINEREDTISG